MSDRAGPQTARAPVPWRAREGLVIWLLALMATFIPALFVAGNRDRLFLVVLGVQEGVLIVLLVVWVRARYGLGASALGFARPRAADVGIGLAAGALGYALAVAATAVALTIAQQVRGRPVEVPKQIDLAARPSVAVLAYIGVAVVLVAPLAEEAFFRGFLYRSFRRTLRIGPAALVSAALFGVAHVEPLIIAPIFALGVVLALVVEERGNLTAAIAAHALFNAVGFALYVHGLPGG